MIPEGVKTKALTLGLSVEEKSRQMVAAMPRLRITNPRTGKVTDWMTVAQTHRFLDTCADLLDKAARKETGR